MVLILPKNSNNLDIKQILSAFLPLYYLDKNIPNLYQILFLSMVGWDNSIKLLRRLIQLVWIIVQLVGIIKRESQKEGLEILIIVRDSKVNKMNLLPYDHTFMLVNRIRDESPVL